MISSEIYLNQQVDDFAQAIENNTNVQALQNKIADTRVMNDKFADYVNNFKSLVVSYQILRAHSYTETTSLESDALKGRFLHAQHLLTQVKKIWQNKKEQLRQHECFSDLLSYLQVCIDELDAHLQQYWQKCVESWQDSFAVPKALLNDIANIPGQTELCSAYSDCLMKFNQLVRTLPQQKETLVLIEKCVEQLTNLQSKMQFDIPENVKSFFANFKYSTDTVSLHLLTPDVFEWLYNKQLLNSFSVQRNWNNA